MTATARITHFNYTAAISKSNAGLYTHESFVAGSLFLSWMMLA